MLVGSLEVHVRRVLEPAGLDHTGPGRTAVEPDVHGIGTLDQGVGLVLVPVGEEVDEVQLPPRVGTLGADNLGDVLDRLLIHERFLRVLVVEARDGHAPGALAGDAPVVAAGDHRAHSLSARGGDKLNLIQLRERLFPEPFHGREPLLGGAEDRGLLSAPVVGVLVGVGLLEDQRV